MMLCFDSCCFKGVVTLNSVCVLFPNGFEKVTCFECELCKMVLLLILVSFYLAENLGVTFWYQSRGLSELSTSRCSQSQAEAKFSAKRFLTLILVFKIYFWKVPIFGKLVFWESFYFWKVGILGKFLFLESVHFWKGVYFWKSGKVFVLKTYYFGKVFETPCIPIDRATTRGKCYSVSYCVLYTYVICLLFV